MAEREVFPFEADRALIAAWLRRDYSLPQTDWLTSTASGLFHNGVTVAWFDTAGALTVSVPAGQAFLTSARVIAEIAKQVGTTVVISRERFDDFVHDPATGGSVHIPFNYFIDDQPYELGSPFVLVGALGMQAWRQQ
jgi:hypothetical protein